jgi:hypothetical protein
MMIKAPRPGASKTRLCPPMRPEEAAALSACFLRDTTRNIADAVNESPFPACGVAVYTPVGAEAAFDNLLPPGFQMLAQRESGFGERLRGALEDLLACGFSSACLIDSDSPTLPRSALERAIESLAQPGDRAVFGGSADGGYYLLGLKRPHGRVFENIDWSTERVATQTRDRAREIGLRVAELPIWYDVDDAASLSALCSELFSTKPSRTGGYPATHTREFLLAALRSPDDRQRLWPAGAEVKSELV